MESRHAFSLTKGKCSYYCHVFISRRGLFQAEFKSSFLKAEWLHPAWPVACGYLSPRSKPQAALGSLHYTHNSNKTALNFPLTKPRSLIEKTTHLSQLSCSDQNTPARRRQRHQNSDPQEGGLSTSPSLLERFSSRGLCLSFRHVD